MLLVACSSERQAGAAGAGGDLHDPATAVHRVAAPGALPRPAGDTPSPDPSTPVAQQPHQATVAPVKHERRAPEEPATGGAARRHAHLEVNSLPLSHGSHRHPVLTLQPDDSISVGTIAAGHLVRGAALPLSGPHHVILAEHQTRSTRWGTRELVELLQETAAKVAQDFPGSLMTLGNISKGGGGDIPWSISHNAGRDADIAFYLVDAQGNQIIPDTMLVLSPPDGTVVYQGQTLWFDPGRNWLLAKAMVDSKSPRMQYVFAAEFLIRKMFGYALANGEDPKYLASLEPILRQPRGTMPHDDHFHVRSFCSTDDQLEGCRDIVGGREIVPRTSPGYKNRVAELTRIMATDGEVTRRGSAVRLLVLLRAPGLSSKLYDLLPTCEPFLCRAAAQGLLRLAARPRPATLVDLVVRTADLETIEAAFLLLRRASTRQSGLIAALLEDTRTVSSTYEFFQRTLKVRVQACLALGWVGSPKAGLKLAELLAAPELEVRQAALWALKAISAAQFIPDAEVEAGPVLDGSKRWQAWHRRHKDRDKNLLASMRAAGYKLRSFSKSNARDLVNAILGQDYLSINAQRKLGELFRPRHAIDLKDKPNARWLWKKELKRWQRHRRKGRR